MARSLKPLHILFAIAAALAAAVVVARVKTNQAASIDVVEPAVKPSRSMAASSAQAAATAAPAVKLGDRQKTIPTTGGDAFGTLSWLPPPPPPPPPVQAAPVVVPPPTAPPLPFTFVGMVERGAGPPHAFLAKGDQLLIVAAGDVIENNNYRVDSLSPTSVVLTYLPMGKQQTINVSGGAP
jgi:hypothetical protein